MPAMRLLGDRRRARPRRLTALLIVLLTVPFLIGATAPLALRTLAPASASTLLDVDHPIPEEPAGAPRGAPGGQRHAIESLGRPTTAERPPRAPTLEATVTDVPPARGERALRAPALRPSDAGWVARRIEVPALGIDVPVAMAGTAAHEDFPPFDGAYILRSSSQPGQGSNAYLFAHAMPNLFKPLWWAEVGQQVIVTMSDGQQLGYRITAVVRDIPCPDPAAPKPAGLPPVLANATECDLRWTLPTPHERLTMQTSQGFNRNYGEMVVIAEPEW